MRRIKLVLAIAYSFFLLGSAHAQTGHAHSTPAFPRNIRSSPAPVSPQLNIVRPAPAPQYAPPLRGQMTVVPQGGYYNPAYAQSEKRQHLGTDYTAASGTPVYAAATGRVQSNTTSLSNPYNSQVTVQQASGGQVVYGHVYSTSTPGQNVQQGQYIGYVQPANTSQPSYNPHLHLGVNTQGNAGQSGWGRAPVTTTQQQAQRSGWVDANGIYHAPQR